MSKLICKVFELLICLELLFLELPLETPDLRLILEKLLFVVHLAHLKPLKPGLLRFVQIVVKDDDGLVFADREAAVANPVLFGVGATQSFFVL